MKCFNVLFFASLLAGVSFAAANQRHGTDSSVSGTEAAIQATYYVSPNGDDRNAGTKASPFKTIQNARNVVRGVNQNMTGEIVVQIAGGPENAGGADIFDRCTTEIMLPHPLITRT